ncbi:adenylate cyclase type 10-like [Aplochiton taeniatus]
MSRTFTKVEELKGAHKIGSIASHVPDLVVYSNLTKEIPYLENFHGVLLFADVSDILASGGDILNYAGDAILALWSVEDRMQLKDVISVAIKCSLIIQDQCGVRETEVGCISAGKLSKVIVGDEVTQYFVVIGRAVDEVRLAEGLAVAGSTILSPNAWELCDRDNISVDPFENERAVKVRYLKRDPTFSIEDYIVAVGKNVEHERTPSDCARKAFRLRPNEKLESCLRKYVMDTVLQKIDDKQPLEYLSEMRPVTIVFVNLQFEGGESDREHCKALHRVAIGIGQQMAHYHGRVNKVFMFDKGCTFLCLFGLPGDKSEEESAHALQAAYAIHEMCQKDIHSLKQVRPEISHVQGFTCPRCDRRTVSVGVTTGPVFCGVVGHPVRHEYTVIGRKVNLAARLMMHYPGVVACDNETSHYSRLPLCYFQELPKKAMKGVQNPGTIYQFMGRKYQVTLGKAPMSIQWEEGYHLLGREKEITLFSKAVKAFLEARDAGHRKYQDVVAFKGDTGYGKSRLLAEVVYRAARNGLRVISFELARTDINQSNYTLQTLLAILLSVEECKSYVEREKRILATVQDPHLRESLCLLNDLLLVKFPVSEAVSLMDSPTKVKEARNFFLELFCKFAKEEPCVYVVDQAHYVDQASWAFLREASQRAPVLIFLALLPNVRQPFPELTSLMEDGRTLCRKLPCLEPPVIAQLACQLLGVVRIPSQVELFLVERSHGVPYYCEELLKSLYLGQLIVIEETREDEEYKCLDVLFPEPTLVVRASQLSQLCPEKGGPSSTSLLKTRKIQPLDNSDSAGVTFVCSVGEAAKFHELPIPLTLKGIALAHLDNLQPAEQMVVKCAAVVGLTFTLRMLTSVLLDATAHKLNVSLCTLFQAGTLECASRPHGVARQPGGESEARGALTCYCSPDGQDADEACPPSPSGRAGQASLDGQWRCQVMRFCTALVKETAYDLWLKEQKKEVHWKCAGYLEGRPYRCRQCHSEEFIFGHKAAAGNDQGGGPPSQGPSRQGSGVALGRGRSATEINVRGNPKKGPNMNQVNPLQPNSDSDRNTFLQTLDGMLKEDKHTGSRSRRCRCDHLVECVLSPLVRHWMGVGDVLKAFYYLLETAAAYSYLANNLKALSYLSEAGIVMDNLKAGRPAFETAEPKRKVKVGAFERALVFRLRGEVLFNTGQIREAERTFSKALKLLKRRLPTSLLAMSVKYSYEKIKMMHYKTKTFDSPGLKRLAFIHEQMCCLSYVWRIGCMRRAPLSRLNASLAMTMEMNSAMLSAQGQKVIFSSIDYYQYCQIWGHRRQCALYERRLCEAYDELPDCMEDLVLMCHFLRTLSIVKLCNGALRESIHYGAGLHAQKVSHLTDQPGLDMWVIIVLHTPLLFTQRWRAVKVRPLSPEDRYEDCIQVLLSLDHLSRRTRICTASGWFYAGCFNFLLYTGFAYRPFDECYLYVEESQSDPNLVADKSLMLNLYSALALWYTRMCEWEKACVFYSKAQSMALLAATSIHTINGIMMFLECHVLLFRKALVEQNKQIVFIYNKTHKHFADFNKSFCTYKMYTPRFLHLKAYVYILAGHEKLATSLLQSALELCSQLDNTLEASWIHQSQHAWFGDSAKSPRDWSSCTEHVPSWEKARGMSDEELARTRYTLSSLDHRDNKLPPGPRTEDVPPPEGKADLACRPSAGGLPKGRGGCRDRLSGAFREITGLLSRKPGERASDTRNAGRLPPNGSDRVETPPREGDGRPPKKPSLLKKLFKAKRVEPCERHSHQDNTTSPAEEHTMDSVAIIKTFT